MALPLENLHAIPDSISDEQAVFVEPLAAACEILEQVDTKQFREAAVLGDGKLAQLIAFVLRTAVPRVVMYGKHEKKLALARRAGIKTKKVRGDASDIQSVKESYGLLVEATGSPTGFALAQHMTEPRGTLVLKSTFHGAAPIETWPIVVKELTVVGSRCGPFDKAIALSALRQSRSDAAHHAHVRSERGARSDSFRSEIRCDESFVESLKEVGHSVYNRLIHDATHAAPKPLSIFTTVTLDAQELSMPSSAATPPKLAP